MPREEIVAPEAIVCDEEGSRREEADLGTSSEATAGRMDEVAPPPLALFAT